MQHQLNKNFKKSNSKNKKEKKEHVYKRQSLLKLHESTLEKILEGFVEKIKKTDQCLKREELRIKKYKIEYEKKTFNIKINNVMTGAKENRESKSFFKQLIIETETVIKNYKTEIEMLKSPEYKDKQISEYLLKTSFILYEYSTLNNDNENTHDIKEDLYAQFEKVTCDNEFNKHVDLKIRYFCPECDIEMTTVSQDGLCCNICGNSKRICNIPEELSYNELQEMGGIRKVFTYDKLSHFTENLKRLCSKENSYIPEEIIMQIKERIQMDNITDYNILTEKNIRDYLKKLNLKKYYENVISILNRINGRKSLKLTDDIEEKLKEMFQKTRHLYDKYKPKDRKNFFSYPFLISKFLQILDLKEFNKYILQLKSKDKIREQDEIFEKIVNDLYISDKTIDWKFIPSV